MSRWVEGTVVNQKAWTDRLHSIYVLAPIEPFIPGQFTQIALQIEGKLVFRPYSFSNASSDHTLEFYYSVLSEGEFTPRLLQLQAGDRITIARKASGRFTLDMIPDARDLWLLATGTGLGVFLSLLRSDDLWKRFSKVVLAHSVRVGEELTHLDVISKITNEQGTRFHYIPIVTREMIPDAFNQRLPRLLQSQMLEQRIGLTIAPAHSHVMLCGNPLMVKDVMQVLAEKGLVLNHANKPGHITIESYWKEKK